MPTNDAAQATGLRLVLSGKREIIGRLRKRLCEQLGESKRLRAECEQLKREIRDAERALAEEYGIPQSLIDDSAYD